MKQTPVSVLCDWLISNSTSKDDVERWMSKDGCRKIAAMHVALNAGIIVR